MLTLERFDTVRAAGEPVPHCDTTVWPDDLGWYTLFEGHVRTPDRAVRVHRATDESGASATLALAVERLRGVTRLGALQNYYSPDFRPICSTPAARSLIGPLIEQVVAAERPDGVTLSPLDPDAPETAALHDAFTSLGWPVRISDAFANWVHDVDGAGRDGAFARYLAARPSRVRRTLARRSRRLLARPGVTLTVHDGADRLDDVVADYLAVYERSWKAAEPHPGFVPALIADSARRGRLRLGVVRADGAPVAVHFWIVKGGCASIYKLAHDRAWDGESPGTVLMGAMLEHVLERDGVSRIDFLSGDDPYKRDWMSERRRKLALRAWNPRSLHGLGGFARETWLSPLAARARTVIVRAGASRRESR